MAVLIASTAGYAVSGDITAIAGTPTTLFLNTGTTEVLPPDARAIIEIKNAGGFYFVVPGGELNLANPVRVIDGPGVFRVVKFPSGTACGVDQS